MKRRTVAFVIHFAPPVRRLQLPLALGSRSLTLLTLISGSAATAQATAALPWLALLPPAIFFKLEMLASGLG